VRKLRKEEEKQKENGKPGNVNNKRKKIKENKM
jgi:hypothetical protein